MGAFYLDGRLGAGGQGVVYEGYGPDGERVAVKALHGVGATEREMLRKEVQAWRKVAPFCTAKVLCEDLDGPVPYIASEYVPGPNLRQAVEEGGPFGPKELRRLAIGVAAALVAVHRAGVVHRDLKPENILLGPDGARLIDFGIARIEPQSTTSGLVKGTLRYMPPERYRGERGDAAVDVWGWGAVVLFAATGRHAFDGATVPLIQRQVAEHEPDVSMLDEPLRSLVRGALAKRAEDRPGSEELLLGLAGGVDVAEAVKGLIARDPFGPVGPSRAEVAESVYAGLGGAAQEAAPQVFLRLVAPGERAEDTVRTARRDEFPDVPGVEEALRAFTEAGILVWEDGRVHPAGGHGDGPPARPLPQRGAQEPAVGGAQPGGHLPGGGGARPAGPGATDRLGHPLRTRSARADRFGERLPADRDLLLARREGPLGARPGLRRAVHLVRHGHHEEDPRHRPRAEGRRGHGRGDVQPGRAARRGARQGRPDPGVRPGRGIRHGPVRRRQDLRLSAALQPRRPVPRPGRRRLGHRNTPDDAGDAVLAVLQRVPRRHRPALHRRRLPAPLRRERRHRPVLRHQCLHQDPRPDRHGPLPALGGERRPLHPGAGSGAHHPHLVGAGADHARRHPRLRVRRRLPDGQRDGVEPHRPAARRRPLRKTASASGT
ncbi:hypothetical protein Acsp04_36640 [Actinomadura sp. NBRC 104425]|uniref:serine/threonine-protein kinase n=1 Tax=Actinomadura sp. NBRC 104425 TaxID=3032204 RepID=UPI0024A1CD9B|nr:serine/threonine-protein kinase [Actinomadura sp. NBRC 104425]GLZ13429.1 hypothetical protein Acsp04_36640 [Actinomadura sp. NBRC 104425]